MHEHAHTCLCSLQTALSSIDMHVCTTHSLPLSPLLSISLTFFFFLFSTTLMSSIFPSEPLLQKHIYSFGSFRCGSYFTQTARHSSTADIQCLLSVVLLKLNLTGGWGRCSHRLWRWSKVYVLRWTTHLSLFLFLTALHLILYHSNSMHYAGKDKKTLKKKGIKKTAG